MTSARVSPLLILLVLAALVMLALVGPMVQALKEVSIPVTGSAAADLPDVYDAGIAGLLSQAVVYDPEYSHAAEEHPDTYLQVRECMENRGPYVTFQVEKNHRYLRTCLLDDGRIGFQIVDIVGKVVKEKTAYVKDTLKCAKDIFDYARRLGYPRFTKPL